MGISETLVITLVPRLAEFLLAGIAGVATVLWSRYRSRDVNLAAANAALESAVAETWDQLVEQLKRASADGRLTAVERKSAQATAKKKAADILASQGLNLLAIMSERAIEGAITRIVEQSKREAGA